MNQLFSFKIKSYFRIIKSFFINNLLVSCKILNGMINAIKNLYWIALFNNIILFKILVYLLILFAPMIRLVK
jgi:hypothetical protein